MKVVFITFLSLITLGISLRAAPIRISFLTDGATLRNTVELFIESGCNREGIDGFKKAVDQFNATPLELDLSKFPPIRSGFYFFPDMTNLVAALPPLFCQTHHAMVINCFDTAILLTTDQLTSNPINDDDAGPFIVEVQLSVTNEYFRTLAATPEDAFHYACPEWYRKASESFVPKSLQDRRRDLIVALDRFYVLPLRTTEENSPQAIAKVLNQSWKKMGLKFPTRCELVLCHSHLSPVEAGTVHAGVMIPVGGQFVYIEKTGVEGPFVRLDFTDRSDLETWLGVHMSVHLGNKAGEYFVTFNDKPIKRLAIPRTSQLTPAQK
jgi:hypothetical protein